MKEKTKVRKGYYQSDLGDAWCHVGIERGTKVVLAWYVGKRSGEDALMFCERLRKATEGRFQLSTDGHRPYYHAIWRAFGRSIDWAKIVKIFGAAPAEGATRYSPPEIIRTEKSVEIGTPDEDKICTSHVERSNLSIRMAMRRMTRLTNAHSKKWENHEAAFTLWFCFYNFCRTHETLSDAANRKTTPAMAAGLTDHVWTLEELLSSANAA
jgi:IS1 family transposase